jgi:RsiW-degrading membrane proteinase PrsW (M82 family)
VRSRTWRRSFLAWTCAAILIAGVILAAIAGALRDPGRRPTPPVPAEIPLGDRVGAIAPPPVREWLDPWMARADFGDVVDAIPALMSYGAELEASIERSLDGANEAIALSLYRAQTGDAAALGSLIALAQSGAPHANLALGHSLPPEVRGQAYETEARLHDSDRARGHALRIYLALGEDAELARLLEEPEYEAAYEPRLRYARAHRDLDWPSLILWIGPSQLAHASATFVLLGVLSGIAWLLFFVHAGGVRSPISARFGLCVAALLLGVVSVVPTLVLSVWMEEVLGIRLDDTVLGGVAYFVVSVGLREELCKLLAFLPLVPILMRRNDPLEILIVAACVGLGFAAEENVNYFAASGGADAAGRFLTANFGHAADTALIGFAFCRMLRDPKKHAGDFAFVFVLIVVGHGVYDALIIVPELAEWNLFSGMIYLFVAFLLFGELKEHARAVKHTIPLTAVFVYGLSTMLAATLIGSAWELGFGAALSVVVPGTITAGIFVFVFFRQIGEPLLP